MEPIVSVLMTAYNREAYIEQAINSVLASTHSNFELIIVDDCSTDKTLEIAHAAAKNDSRIRVYKNEKNLGDYVNRNKAASYAKGKYIKYVDSDDMIYPHGLEVMLAAMERFEGAGVGIVSAINQDDQPFPYQLNPKEAFAKHFYKTGIFDTGPSGLIFRTEYFREIKGFSGRRFIGDTEINLRLASKWPVVMIASSLVYWRTHPGQEYKLGHNTTGYLESFLPMIEAALNKPGIPLEKDQIQNIIKYYRKISARQLLKMIVKSRNLKHSVTISKQLGLNYSDYMNAIFRMKKRY
jgi:glycosyltransferase involved in cell wall biosynthesis